MHSTCVKKVKIRKEATAKQADELKLAHAEAAQASVAITSNNSYLCKTHALVNHDS